MSRSTPFVLAALSLAACQVPVQPSASLPTTATALRRTPSLAAVEAALYDLENAHAVAASTIATDPYSPEILAVDPVVVELLRSAYRAYGERRRTILENIANVNTPGFKKRVVLTRTHAVVGVDGTPVPVPAQLGTAPVFTTGTLEVTERCLDVAIDGDGFFSVVLSDGKIGYTRNGQLQVNADGKLVTSEGRVVAPEITLPNDLLEVSIDPEGRVAGRTAGSLDTMTLFGQLQLHRFINPAGLLPIDATTWRVSDSSGNPTTSTPGLNGLGTLKQGFLERSNVELELELMNLQLLERQHRVLEKVLAQFGMIAP